MEEVTDQHRHNGGVMIMGDIQPFRSSVDGTVITGRRALREHNKRHNVTNPADFRDQWRRQAKERQAVFTPGSGFDKERRREKIIAAIDRHSRGK